MERQSPLNSAVRIKTPLLGVQGANDPRVKQDESDQIVIALRDRGFPVEYILAPDRLRAAGEQHGDVRRCREVPVEAPRGTLPGSMPSEVAARLKEITVDPKAVKLKGQ
jgi:hypothetical protein